jgi:hypothetical protein
MASIDTDVCRILLLGDARISQYPGYTVTAFPDGTAVTARHDDCAQLGQAQCARRLGYPSPEAMNAEHDLTHSLLAQWLGASYSPTLYAQAHGGVYPWWGREEDAVLAVQRLAVAWGVSLLTRAQRYATSSVA